jgi:hypothetical protein
MHTIRAAVAALLFLLLETPGSPLHYQALADPPEKPATTAKEPPAKGEKRSFWQDVKKGLKGLETRIPAETSKAARVTKEGFKKRFNTTHEESKKK